MNTRTFDPAQEDADIARIPDRPYGVIPDNSVAIAAILMAYRFVTGRRHNRGTRYEVLAENLLHRGHGALLHVCSNPLIIESYSSFNDPGGVERVASAINALDPTLKDIYPTLRECELFNSVLVTGRIVGDDEDIAKIFSNTSRAGAVKEFSEEIRKEAEAEGYDGKTLEVVINIVASSTTPITFID